MSRFQELTVWQASKELAITCYRETADFPKNEEYGLKSQIRRAAVSISSNIAEGSGRYSDRDFIRFLRIAQGSASELESLLFIATELRLIGDQADELARSIPQVRRMLAGLIRSLSD